MRHWLFALGSLAIIALAAPAAADPAPGTSGKPPAQPGAWRCVARHVKTSIRTNEITKVKESFQKVTVTWVSGGKTWQDSWDAK
ncbi:MAG: hypothetical protein ACHP84_15190 [Caulobacterales bacterium]